MAGSPKCYFCAVGSVSALVGLSLVVGGLFALCGVVHCGVSHSQVKPVKSMPSQISVPMPSPGRHGVVVSVAVKQLAACMAKTVILLFFFFFFCPVLLQHNDYRCASAPTQLSDGYIGTSASCKGGCWPIFFKPVPGSVYWFGGPWSRWSD